MYCPTIFYHIHHVYFWIKVPQIIIILICKILFNLVKNNCIDKKRICFLSRDQGTLSKIGNSIPPSRYMTWRYSPVAQNHLKIINNTIFMLDCYIVPGIWPYQYIYIKISFLIYYLFLYLQNSVTVLKSQVIQKNQMCILSVD